MDVAVAWGPLAGYPAATSDAPIEPVPLDHESFDISMGVARGNDDLKDRLEAAIDRRQAQILAILEEYGVPAVPASGGSGAPNRNAEASSEGAVQPEPPSAAAATPPAPPAAPRKLNPFTGNADMAAERRTLYFQVGCQGCHGGGSGGEMATSVIDDAWTLASDDDVLFRLIKGKIADQTRCPPSTACSRTRRSGRSWRSSARSTPATPAGPTGSERNAPVRGAAIH